MLGSSLANPTRFGSSPGRTLLLPPGGLLGEGEPSVRYEPMVGLFRCTPAAGAGAEDGILAGSLAETPVKDETKQECST